MQEASICLVAKSTYGQRWSRLSSSY